MEGTLSLQPISQSPVGSQGVLSSVCETLHKFMALYKSLKKKEQASVLWGKEVVGKGVETGLICAVAWKESIGSLKSNCILDPEIKQQAARCLAEGEVVKCHDM